MLLYDKPFKEEILQWQLSIQYNRKKTLWIDHEIIHLPVPLTLAV